MKHKTLLLKLFSLLLALSMLFVLVSCGKGNDTEETTNGFTETEPSGDGKDEGQKGNKYTFRIKSFDFSQTLDVAKLKLYRDDMQFPIQLQELDGISAPYVYWVNNVNSTNAATMAEIMADTALIRAKGDAEISTQTAFIEKWIDYDEDPDHIESIMICNLTDETRTIAQCVENDWWYITNQHSLDDALRVDLTGNGEYRNDWNEWPLLEKAIAQMGDPSYIYYQSSLAASIEENDGMIFYDLVYDYGEFVVAITVSEMIMSEYDVYNFTVGLVRYCTKAYWESELAQSGYTMLKD